MKLGYIIKLSYLLACFAWINTFALLWVILFMGEEINNKGATLWALAFFIGIALVTSGIQGQQNK